MIFLTNWYTNWDFAGTNWKMRPMVYQLVIVAYGCRLRSNSNIASDCQGAIKTLQRAKSGRRPKGIQGHITAKYTLQSVRERTEAFWVRSHPELDKNKNGWCHRKRLLPIGISIGLIFPIGSGIPDRGWDFFTNWLTIW